ncbi:hypothetical protein ACFWOI_26220, partial [Streptomyces sp. NPDC058424]
MLLRLAYLAATNTLALLRLLPMSDREKDIEIRLSCRFRGPLTRADTQNTPYPGYVSTCEGTKRKNLDTACDLQGY